MKYTKYEIARLLGARATQLAMGAPLLVKISKEEFVRISYSTLEIAKKEFAKGLLPITIKRPMPSKFMGHHFKPVE